MVRPASSVLVDCTLFDVASVRILERLRCPACDLLAGPLLSFFLSHFPIPPPSSLPSLPPFSHSCLPHTPTPILRLYLPPPPSPAPGAHPADTSSHRLRPRRPSNQQNLLLRLPHPHPHGYPRPVPADPESGTEPQGCPADIGRAARTASSKGGVGSGDEGLCPIWSVPGGSARCQ